jgi:chloramphenicol 3-O phosphotransferase
MTPGTIILINGASSSGKTSIIKALQELLEEPYVDAGLDKFLWMLPGRYLERPLWDEVLGLADRAGPVGHQLVAGMHQAIAALSLAGINVLADHVLVEPDWLRQCISLFSPLPAFFVGVRCPLDVLEQREQLRRNRTWGQARVQYEQVHAHGIYDLDVDTSISSPEDCAQQIRGRIRSGDPPFAFKRLKALQEDNNIGIRSSVKETPKNGV